MPRFLRQAKVEDQATSPVGQTVKKLLVTEETEDFYYPTRSLYRTVQLVKRLQSLMQLWCHIYHRNLFL